MKIDSINNTQFTSRNSTIRSADKFIHVFNSEFPSISTSKVDKFKTVHAVKNVETFEDICKIKNIKSKKAFNSLLFIRKKYFESKRKFDASARCDRTKFKHDVKDSKVDFGVVDYYKAMVNMVRSRKEANCIEMNDIMRLILGVNGIEVHKASLEPRTIFDHEVLVVPLDKTKGLTAYSYNTPMTKMKDIIIIDAWNEFADYAPNAAIRFITTDADRVSRRLYDGGFPIPKDGHYHNKLYLSVVKNDSLAINANERETLKKEFPELILN